MSPKLKVTGTGYYRDTGYQVVVRAGDLTLRLDGLSEEDLTELEAALFRLRSFRIPPDNSTP